MASVAKWLRQRIVVPPFVGSSPIVRPDFKFHPINLDVGAVQRDQDDCKDWKGYVVSLTKSPQLVNTGSSASVKYVSESTTFSMSLLIVQVVLLKK